MKAAVIEKGESVRKNPTRVPRKGRVTQRMEIEARRAVSHADPQVAEFERTFSVRWEW